MSSNFLLDISISKVMSALQPSPIREHHALVMKELCRRTKMLKDVCAKNREQRHLILQTETQEMQKIIQMKVADNRRHDSIANSYRAEYNELSEERTRLLQNANMIQYAGDIQSKQSPGDLSSGRDVFSSRLKELESRQEHIRLAALQSSHLFHERSEEFSLELDRIKKSIINFQSVSSSDSSVNAKLKSAEEFTQTHEKIVSELEKERDVYKKELKMAEKKLSEEGGVITLIIDGGNENSADFVRLSPEDMDDPKSNVEILWKGYPSEKEQRRAVEEMKMFLWPILLLMCCFFAFGLPNTLIEKCIVFVALIKSNILDYRGWTIFYFVSVLFHVSSISDFIDRLHFYEKENGTEYAVSAGILIMSLSNLVRSLTVC